MTSVPILTCHINRYHLFEVGVTYDTGNANTIDDQ